MYKSVLSKLTETMLKVEHNILVCEAQYAPVEHNILVCEAQYTSVCYSSESKHNILVCYNSESEHNILVCCDSESKAQ